MSGASRTRDFFESGSAGQFEWVLGFYDEALRLKAESKSSKPENVIKLDKWYQSELPKKIKARGKEAHLIHDELVQTIKWKLARGKFQASMVNLVQMNTPRVVMQETKKAFRNIFKRGNIESAAQALCNLKGVGPTMASAVLAAGAPHLAPFMADECLLAMPDGESLDYTMKEYMRFVEYVQNCVERLKSQGGEWTPHKVELAVWTHFVMNEYKPEVLTDMPGKNAVSSAPPMTSSAASSSNGTDQENGANTSDEECGTKVGASSVSNGEDSVSSPPPASFSTPSPSETANAAAGNGNGNHGEFDDDSNAAKDGDFSLPPSDHDENSVPDINDVSSADNDVSLKNGGDRVSSPEEESVSEITLPESNGTLVQENGNKEISSVKVSESDNSLSPPPSIQPTETEQLTGKRPATPEGQTEEPEQQEHEPATKKFKPEDDQQTPQQQQQPEAVATAVV